MAREDNDLNSELDNSPEGPSAPKKMGRAKRWIITIIVALIVIGISIGAIYLVYTFFIKAPDLPSTSFGDEAPSTNAQLLERPPLFTSPFSYQVNLAGGRRYLAVDMRFEVVDGETISYLVQRLPILNDLIIGTLQRKSTDDLSTAAGVDELKRELKRRINSGKIFDENFIKLKKTSSPIRDVFFDKFILQ